MLLGLVFTLTILIAALLPKVISAETQSTQQSTQQQYAAFADSVLSDQEQAFFELINAHRKSLGLAPLTPCPNLMFGARRWATRQGYGHASGGYNGECIAPAATAKAAFGIWLDSDGHRRIMEGVSYRYGGIGFNRGRAVLRVSQKPWASQDTTSTGNYVMRSRLFQRLR
jgi:uncharacterized protein YkwD